VAKNDGLETVKGIELMQKVNLHVRATPEQYHAFTASGITPWDDLLIDALLAELQGRPPGGRVVDIGAGTAVLLVKLAGVTRSAGLDLIATDYFEDMLVQARQRIAEAGFSDRIVVERQDAHGLSYADGSCRYVISRSTLHHWSDPVQALREIYRVLEPGGVALIHDVRRDAPADIIAMLDATRARHRIGPMRLEEKLTPDEVVAMCAAAGIAHDAEVRCSSDGAAALGFELRIART
jgi:ubiquinone/menaquinone biosynthesis C-methylase UbiE